MRLAVVAPPVDLEVVVAEDVDGEIVEALIYAAVLAHRSVEFVGVVLEGSGLDAAEGAAVQAVGRTVEEIAGAWADRVAASVAFPLPLADCRSEDSAYTHSLVAVVADAGILACVLDAGEA